MSIMRRQPFSELISLRPAMEKIKREHYLYREHRYGTFSRSGTLPVASTY